MMSVREVKITNTLSGKKDTLQTRTPGKLTMYSCGPTVWNLIHIGNLRTALVADMLYRYFKKIGFEVTYVRNYTDVDDKIIGRAIEEKITPEAVAQKYTQEVEKDYAVAGMLEPTHKTKATEHIPEMLSMIQDLISRNHAYVVEGEVLFSIESFHGYGKLSHRNVDELQAGARVEIDKKKRNPLDFSLWKPAKPGEPSWDSPWGKGRPGWHIECSAMASKWMGAQIDLHHGGVDLIFPHHENEIAQSEGASGKDPFVKYWVHNAHVLMNKAKMSKSVGNVFSARDFLTQYSGELARYMMLSVHYRSEIDFSESTIEQAIGNLQRIYEAKAKAKELTSKKMALPDLRAEGLWGSFIAECEQTRKKIDEAFASDLNAAEALGAFFSLARELNRVLMEPKAQATPGAVLGAQLFIEILETDLGDVLGFGRLQAEKALTDLIRIKGMMKSAQSGSARPERDEIERLIAERGEAKKNKDFARADAIRKDLAAKGVLLKDSPQGTTWDYQ